MKRGFGVLVWVLLSFGTSACSRARQERAYADELSRAHAAADRAVSDEQVRSSARQLERIFALAPPNVPEATALRQDAADRIARLHLRLLEPNVAFEWTRRGLEESEAETVLRATLLITEADALEALGRRDEARAALMAALETNQALLHVELENP
jgi:tetratricopeptide (TPR) repeat protein